MLCDTMLCYTTLYYILFFISLYSIEETPEQIKAKAKPKGHQRLQWQQQHFLSRLWL